MITTIPNIYFSGDALSPYSISWDEGYEDPSYLNLVFIDRNGNYNIASRFARNSSVPVSLNIGGFQNFTGYIVEAEETEDTNGGFRLSVKIVDSSILLDKYHVALKGLQGPGFSTVANGTYGNMIFVGKQIDPCKNIPPNYPDPCAPDCGPENGGQESFNCEQEKLLKILEVDYSFDELRAAVAGIVKFGDLPVGINTEYRANYTGTIREVLKSWSQDFGMTFYWSENAVYFYDLMIGRDIDDSGIDQNMVISRKTNYSIDGNLTQGNVSYFGGEGEIREYSCVRSSSKRYVLRPITLFDVIEDNDQPRIKGSPGYSFLVNNYNPKDKNITLAKRNLFEAIVLNYYSDVFRDLYFLFEREDLDTALKMYNFSIDTVRKPLPMLGQFKPTKVCYVTKDGSQNAGIYNTLLKRMTPNEQVDFTNRGGYFIAAKYNKEVHEKFNNFEKRMAEEFMGKYWIRGGVDGDSFSFDAPDGSPTHYSNGGEMQFPFIQVLPADIQRTSDLLEDLIGEYDPTKPDKAHGSFLVMERSAAWVPNQTADSVKKIIEELEKITIEILGSEDVNAANVLKEGEVWMKVFPRPKGLDLKISNRTREENNPYDAKNVRLNTEIEGVSTTYGLRSSVTQTYGLKTASSFLQIFLPSQAGPKYGSEYPGYDVLANGNDFTNEIKRVIPKAEYTLGSVPTTTSKDVGIRINFRDASQSILDLYKANGNTCGYDQNKILALLNNYTARFNNPASIERETRTYELSGIPMTKFTPRDGLSSFNINQSDDGVKTSVTFSNLPKLNKTEAMIMEDLKKLESELKYAKKYYRQYFRP